MFSTTSGHSQKRKASQSYNCDFHFREVQQMSSKHVITDETLSMLSHYKHKFQVVKQQNYDCMTKGEIS